MTAAMDHLAKGDKTTEISAQGLTDEVGLLATAVQVFKDNMLRADTLAADQEQARTARKDRDRKVDQLTRDYDNIISVVLGQQSSATQDQQSTIRRACYTGR